MRKVKNHHNSFDNIMKKDEEIMYKKAKDFLLKLGFSKNQIKSDFIIEDHRNAFETDFVVTEKENPQKILLIVKVKQHSDNLVEAEFKLQKLMTIAKAEYGIIYSKKIKFLKLINNVTVEISHIPNTKHKQKTGKPIDDPLEKFEIILRKAHRLGVFDESLIEELPKVLLSKIYDEKFNNNKTFKNLSENPLEILSELDSLWKKSSEKFSSLGIKSKIKLNTDFVIVLCHELKDFSITKTDNFALAYALSIIFSERYNYSVNEGLYASITNLFNPKGIVLQPDCAGGDALVSFAYWMNQLHLKIKPTKKKYFNLKLVGITEEKELVRFVRFLLYLINPNNEAIQEDPLDTRYFSKFENVTNVFINFSGNKISPRKSFGKKLNEHIKYVGHYFDHLLLNEVIYQAKSGTNIVCITPTTLFSSSTLQNFKQDILDECFVKAIIEIPQSTFLSLNLNLNLVLLEKKSKTTQEKQREQEIPYKIFISKLPIDKPITENEVFWYISNITLNYSSTIQGIKFKKNAFVSVNDQNFVIDSRKLRENVNLSSLAPSFKSFGKEQYIKKLSDIAEIFTGTYFSTSEKGEVPYIRISDLNLGKINRETNRSINLEKIKINKKIIRVQENDILFSCQATIGKIAIANEDDVGSIISPHIAIIRIHQKDVDPSYILRELGSDNVLNQVRLLEHGSIIRRINSEEIGQIMIPIPSLQYQHKTIKKFNFLMKKLVNLQKETEDTQQELRNIRLD